MLTYICVFALNLVLFSRNLSCDSGKFRFFRCMSFPELLISKCEEFLAKTAIRVSFSEKSYGIQS